MAPRRDPKMPSYFSFCSSSLSFFSALVFLCDKSALLTSSSMDYFIEDAILFRSDRLKPINHNGYCN